MNILPATLLPPAIGWGWVSRGCTWRSVVRSHVHDGRSVHCVAREDAALAVDAESIHSPAATELAARHDLSVGAFLALWTRAEVAAKLLGLPSLLTFREGFGDDPALAIRTTRLDDLVVSVGWPRRGE